MSWVLLGGRHINTEQVQAFYWHNGLLLLWFAGDEDFSKWSDPDRQLYAKLCHALGVRPYEEVGIVGEK